METRNFTVKSGQRPLEIIAHDQPSLADQAYDTTRQRLIVSAAEMEYGLGSDTSISGNVPEVRVHTEHEALVQTILLLEDAITHPEIPREIAARAKDVYENLSFIGEKELVVATRSIAEYWKAYLEGNPSLALFIVTSKTFECESSDYEEDTVQQIDLGHVSENKSDSYILDRVLSNFTDEELQKYGDRLLFSSSELENRASLPTKTIILDDWIMSGQQMQKTLNKLFEYVIPDDLEINLVASNRERLANGFAHDLSAGPIPVKACFVSRVANHSYASEFGGAYLTAAHSTGDYPFEGAIEEIVGALNEVSLGETVYMPPLTNIIRPYYAPDYLPKNIERYKSVRAMARAAFLGRVEGW